MTSAQVNVVIALAGLGFLVLTTMLGLLVRATLQWAGVRSDLTVLRKDLDELCQEKKEAHTVLYQMMKDDRAATNDRLTFLERKRMTA